VKWATLAALLLPIAGVASAQTPKSAAMPDPSTETIAVPAQPGVIALPEATDPDREVWHLDSGHIAVRNVTRPTLLPFLPMGQTSGTAVIVAPGGGFLGLAIEREGWDVARWLANHGVTAFVLKYRVLPTPASQPEFADKLLRAIRGEKVGFAPPDDTPDAAYADGVAALRYVRSHAKEFGVDPRRVGFMGFSAGGFLTRTLLERAGADAPAFAAPIYPNMAAIKVPADAPPMFVAIAADDFLLKRVTGFPLVESYRAAGRPVEFHLFASGDHGFGTGIAGTPTEGWMNLYLNWLNGIGMLSPRNVERE